MGWNLNTIKMEVLLAFVFQHSIHLEGCPSLGNVGLEVDVFNNGHRRIVVTLGPGRDERRLES